MKSLVIFAALAAACGGVSAQAQTIPTAPTQILAPNGLTYGNTAAATVFPPTSKTSPLATVCLSTINVPTFHYEYTAGGCSTSQLAGGSVNTLATINLAPDGTSLGSLPSQTVTTVPQAALASGSGVYFAAQGVYLDPSSPTGISYFQGNIPLSAFTAAGTSLDSAPAVNALNSKLDTLIADQLNAVAAANRAQDHMMRGIAMASALNLSAPLAGNKNRLALGYGAFRSTGAVSVNYSRRTGHYDLNAAAGFSGKDSLAKVGVGVSW